MFDDHVKQGAEHHENYGFASNPSEANAVALTVGGITVLIGLQRSEGRPALAADEVAVWHKSGHLIKLFESHILIKHKAGHSLSLLPSGKVRIHGADLHVTGNITSDQDVVASGISLINHTHPQMSGNHFGGGTSTGAAQ
jgi:phage gp45-like